MDNESDKIPKNCDKILFAEDIVSNLMYCLFSIEYEPSIATPYREFIYQAFNEDIKMAIVLIYDRVDDYRMLNGIMPSPPTRNKFKKFSKRLRKQYFDRGFDAQLFLYYCAHLLIRVERLAATIGTQEAGDLAVGCISEALGDWDMFHGGWSVLNMLAARYRSLDWKVERDSPLAMLSLFGSDDEAPRNSASEEEGSDGENRLQNADEDHLEVGEVNRDESRSSESENRLQNVGENRLEVEEVGELNKDESIRSDSENRLQNPGENRLEVEEMEELNRDESSHPKNSNDNQGVAVKGKNEPEVKVNIWLTANNEESKSSQNSFEGSGRLPVEGTLAKEVEVPKLDKACTSSEKASNEIKTAKSDLSLPSSSNDTPSTALLFMHFINTLSGSDKNESSLQQRTSILREHKGLENSEFHETYQVPSASSSNTEAKSTSSHATTAKEFDTEQPIMDSPLCLEVVQNAQKN